MSTENLSNKDGVEKLKKLVDDIDICMFCSAIKDGRLHAVPMSRQEVDDAGVIWFLGSAESDTCKNIEADNRVQLQFANTSAYSFLAVSGVATVTRDKDRIEKYWNKLVEAWFEQGVDDPKIRVISVTPQNSHYWDTKDGKLFTMVKIATAAITGKDMDTGREGKIDV